MKEYDLDKFKIIDDGYKIEIYQVKTDKFKNTYYSHLNYYSYKENLNDPKTASIYGIGLEGVNEIGKLIKMLLEENEHLKFYRKVDKELE